MLASSSMMSISMWFMLLAKGACSDKPVTNFSLHDVQYTSQPSRTFAKSVKFLSSFFRFPLACFCATLRRKAQISLQSFYTFLSDFSKRNDIVTYRIAICLYVIRTFQFSLEQFPPYLF